VQEETGIKGNGIVVPPLLLVGNSCVIFMSFSFLFPKALFLLGCCYSFSYNEFTFIGVPLK